MSGRNRTTTPLRSFDFLHSIASVFHGNTLPSDAVLRMIAVDAPRWIILGLLSADCSKAEQGSEFGFTSRWFGVIAALDGCDEITYLPQGEC